MMNLLQMSDYDEPTTIDNLLKHLLKEISVDVEVESDESSEAENPMKLRFIVKNMRSPDELPGVVFQNLTDLPPIAVPLVMSQSRQVRPQELVAYTPMSYEVGCNYTPAAIA